jgi:hypothetical protein
MRLLSVGQLGPARAGGAPASLDHTHGTGRKTVDKLKLKLSLDSLTVDSFTTDRTVVRFGTVRAHDNPTDFNACGISNPCTTDGQATINAALCQTAGDDTIGGTTCGRTNICCGISRERTMACCQGTANCPP